MKISTKHFNGVFRSKKEEIILCDTPKTLQYTIS